MSLKRCLVLACALIGLFTLINGSTAFAEPAQQVSETSEGGYLSSYKEPADTPVQSSWWSTLAYLFSLMIVFSFVAVLAYFASKFLGGKMSNISASSSSKILDSLSLGANKSICVVEIAGKVMVLGITEQSITLLEDIEDEDEIEKLRSEAGIRSVGDTFQHIFEKQVLSLEKISNKLPEVFKKKTDRK